MSKTSPIKKSHGPVKAAAVEGSSKNNLNDTLSSSSVSENVVVINDEQSSTQSTIPFCFQDGGKLNAEVRWTIKHVVSGYSDNSIADTIPLFTEMFPCSKVAPIMELGKDKLKYLVNHGIAPYFQELLKEEVCSSRWFSVSYDESLNKSVQESEMDLVIRFWDNKNDKVEVRYWDSLFLGHATAKDLLKQIDKGLAGLDRSKHVQLAMDGPNVNWKVLSDMAKEREEAGLSKLINIGSCNLHIVHGALQTATAATGWDLKSLLKGSFQVFKDSPARREDFISVTGSSQFPLQYSPTRWVENERIALRLMKVWPNITKMVKFWEKGPASKRPTSKSYIAMKKGTEDPLIVPKLSFFCYIASLLEPYLVKYQADKPMLPFLGGDLEKLHKALLALVVKHDVLQNHNSAIELLKIDLTDSDIYLKVKEMHFGFSTEQEIKTLLRNDEITQKQVKAFKKEAGNMVVTILEKITEKSPMNRCVVRNANVFDPVSICSLPSSDLQNKMKKLLTHLVSLKIISPNLAEKALTQYQDLVTQLTQQCPEKLKAFDDKEARLDDFFLRICPVKFPNEIKSIFTLILTLSHGQVAVERGFNVNKSVNKVNISEKSEVRSQFLRKSN